NLFLAKGATGNEASAEGLQALLVHFVHRGPNGVATALTGVLVEEERRAATALGYVVRRGGRDDAVEAAQVSEILVQRGVEVVALREALEFDGEHIVVVDSCWSRKYVDPLLHDIGGVDEDRQCQGDLQRDEHGARAVA